MPAPVAYTEAELADYLITALGETATVLGWTSATDQVEEAVNDALLAYFGGAGDVADATDIPKLRALVRVAAWQSVVRWTATRYHFAEGTAEFDRQQVHDQALKALAEAEREAGLVGAGPALVVTPVSYVHDPYACLPDESRVLP